MRADQINLRHRQACLARCLASARDLVQLFVALELVSIPTYILLYLGRRDAESQEAAAKYFYLSIFASALTASPAFPSQPAASSNLRSAGIFSMRRRIA